MNNTLMYSIDKNDFKIIRIIIIKERFFEKWYLCL